MSEGWREREEERESEGETCAEKTQQKMRTAIKKQHD